MITKTKILLGILIIVLLIISFAFVISYIKQERGPKSIEGWVYNELREPIPGANVEISFKRERSLLFIKWESSFSKSTLTDEKGYFEFSRYYRDEKIENFPAGTYDITVSVGEISKTSEIKVEEGMVPIELSLPITAVPKGFLSGYITNFALEPIKGVRIYEKIRGISTETDERGYYSFSDIEPGRAELTLSASGHEGQMFIFNILAGIRLKKNFSLPTTGKTYGGIEGIVSYNGIPLENAEAFILLNGQVVKVKSDSSGKYKIENIPPGRYYRIIVVKGNYYPVSVIVDISSSIFTKKDLVFKSILEGGWIGGFITDEQGNPIDGAYFRRKMERSTSTTQSDSTGFYTTGDFQYSPWPEVLVLEISAAGYETQEEKVALSKGEYLIRNYILKKK